MSTIRTKRAPAKSDLPAQPNKSLIDGLECFQAVVAAGRPLGCRELARLLDVEVTRVNRLLKTLNHLRLLERTPQGRYQPGSAVHVLAAMSLQGSHLLAAALPHARGWWTEGYALTLGVLWNQHLCHLLHARPERPFDQAIAGHEVVQAPQSSAGLVLLAYQSPKLVRQWQFEQGERLVDPVKQLTKQLELVRRDGYAVRHYRDGAVSVGVPIGDPPVAAFAVSQPLIPADAVPLLAQRLHTTAKSIHSQMFA